MATNQFVARNGIISLNDNQITGSLYVSGTVSANLQNSIQPYVVSYDPTSGAFTYESTSSLSSNTASYAISASYAESASRATSAANADTASYVENAQTASYVLNAVSSSYALTASYAANVPVTASYALTASYIEVAQTASYVTLAQTASFVENAVSASRATSAANADTASYVENAQTASYALQAVSASYATTASFATNATNFTASNLLVNGTITAQSLNVQYVSSSTIYSSGSNVFGNDLTNTQQLTGSVSITGSLAASLTNQSQAYIVAYDITSGQFTYQGTGSFTATSASYAVSASYASASTYAETSSYATVFTINDSVITTAGNSSTSVGSNIIFNQATGSYNSAFYKYSAVNGSNSRVGEVIASFSNGAVTFTDFSTIDNGSTTPVTMSAAIVGANIQLLAQTNTSGWNIKSQVTYL